jgi:cell division protease FtsH
MPVIIPESELPLDLTRQQAVEIAYSEVLADTTTNLLRGLPVLIECDKDLAPFFYGNVRDRLKQRDIRCLYLNGNVPPEQQAGMLGGLMGAMLAQFRDAVRGAVDERVVVMPHIDLLVTGQGGLTSEAREVIPLLYENPDLVWLGFKDPSFPLPQVIENLFPKRYSVLGIPRPKLKQLVTQKEARKFGQTFNPWNLYKYVSGVNAVRLRKLLSTVEGEDYPQDPINAFKQVRNATTGSSLEVPSVDLDKEVGGYQKVKDRLKTEILDVLSTKDAQSTEEDIKRLEGLIPRGMIFWGPPGTGKTLFAKAMATAIGAAITIVSGPELKSRWVGESEERIRQIFQKARQSAPSIIVFDELDSFASARGTYTGSGVEHSMVNQLLTELDGFHSEELVFVVGTTNFVESLDPALMRPGRFEFHLHIPHPEKDDRRAILEIYNEKMKLEMSEAAIDFAVKRTGEYVEGAAAGTRFTGDHINALCRAMARIRLRESIVGPSESDLVDQALTQWVDRPKMTSKEEFSVATHEAGHAVCSMFCPNSPPIDRISIRADMAGALGFVRYKDPTHKYVVTQNELLDDICVLMGGREAELLLLDDLSIGSMGDLQRATAIGRALVEEFGMGGDAIGVCQFPTQHYPGKPKPQYSPAQLEAIDNRVREILEEQRQRSINILTENRVLVETLRDILVKEKVIEATSLAQFNPKATGESKTETALDSKAQTS